MSVPLTKVDSAIAGLSISDEKPEIQKEVKAKTHRRASSTVEGVWNIKDLGKNIIKSQWRKLYWWYCRRAKDRHWTTNRNTEDWLVSISSQFLTYTSISLMSVQETQHLPLHHWGQRHPQNAPHHSTRQEDWPTLPPGPRSHRTEPQGRHDQGRIRCHLQAVQEEGQWFYSIEHKRVHDDWRGPARRMMNSTNPTSLASSGTRKSAGPGWSCTRRRRVHHSQARSPRRSPRTRHRLASAYQPGCFMTWPWTQTIVPGWPLQSLLLFIPSLYQSW